MFQNYIIVALRNIFKTKTNSFINISGLAIGMACSILMLMWVFDELSFDQFHVNRDNLYRVAIESREAGGTRNIAISPAPLAVALKDETPEIIKTTRFANKGIVLNNKETRYNETAAMVDSDIFEMFTFPLIKGDPATALKDPHSIIMTIDMAKKYFGDEDPMGKALTLDNRVEFKVTAILGEIPHNSTLKFDILIPFEYQAELVKLDNWNAWMYTTYVLLSNNSQLSEVNKKISGIMTKHNPNGNDILYLQPFKDIHLRSNLNYDLKGRGDIKYVWILSTLALFVMLIACINFMNLVTARASKRSIEIGLRKVVGATRSDIIKQFYGESLILSFAAMILAVLLLELTLPVFNELSGKNLTLSYFGEFYIVALLFSVALFSGLVSGSYPAIYLSSFKPVRVLRGQFKMTNSRSTLRKALVVIQFTLSVFLISGAYVVSSQADFMRNKDLGFNKEQIVYMRIKPEFLKQYPTLKTELLQNKDVISVSASFQLPTDIGSSPGTMDWEGRPPGFELNINAGLVDFDYFKTMDMELAEGRFFSKDFAADTSTSYILNEEAVRQMGINDPVGKWFSFWSTPGTIIGVVKDFHSTPLHNKINPIVLKMDTRWLRYVLVKINSEDFDRTLSDMENSWKKVLPDFPFEYQFLDDTIENLYRTEERIGLILEYATILAIVIACLGLYALASFMAEQRTKEIGIRKILGSSVPGIIMLLSREFIILVTISIFIAWPAAYFIMNNWLSNFAYRISFGFEAFALSGGLVLAIAILTISYQSIRASLSNPVKSLRYE